MEIKVLLPGELLHLLKEMLKTFDCSSRASTGNVEVEQGNLRLLKGNYSVNHVRLCLSSSCKILVQQI